MKPSLAPTRKVAASARESRSSAAAVLIVCLVGCQFVDLTIATIGGFVISVQKIVSFCLIPIGVLALGRLRGSQAIGVVGVTGVGSFLAAWISGATSGGVPLAELVALTLSILAALVLYSALVEVERPVDRLSFTWLFFSTVTSIVCVAQTFEYLPLFSVTDDALLRRATGSGLQRATGFKFDPNFAALVLVLGLVFARHVRLPRARILLTIVHVVAVAATLSRMGMIVAILILLASSGRWCGDQFLPRRRFGMPTVLGALPVLLGVAATPALPSAWRTYVADRWADLVAGLMQLFAGRSGLAPQTGSGVERAALLRSTLEVIGENFAVGLGPNALQARLGWTIGVEKGAHNTYLEAVAIGGILGVLFLLGYFGVVLLALGPSRLSRRAEGRDIATLRLYCAAFAIMAGAVTLSYNAILWIPLAVVAAAATHSGRAEPNRDRHNWAINEGSLR